MRIKRDIAWKALILLLLLLSAKSYAQKYNNIWMFGASAGLDFNADPPKSIKGLTAFPQPEPFQPPPYYTSSICDTNGNLLFYTDGITLWNKSKKEVEKNKWPWSGFMMPLICPYPGNDSLFYLFGVSKYSYANRLQCVTISAKTGRDVAIVYPLPSTINNYYTKLIDGASLFVAGTHACNGKDIWIVSESNSKLYSYLITAAGIDTIPIISDFSGTLPTGFINGGYGNIKFSASGERLVLPSADDHAIYVFYFNNQTGKFSSPLKILTDAAEELEDIELSPDGSKLYYASEKQSGNEEIPGSFHDVYQFDLSSDVSSAIHATKIKLSYSEHEACSPRTCIYVYKTLQLAPDGKIYVSQRTATTDIDHTLSVIQFPNRAGPGCFYKTNAVDLGLKYYIINYNYVRSFNYTIEKNGIQIQKSNCKDKPVEFSLLYKNVDSVKWDFGNLVSGSNNFSTSLNPQHTYPGVGAYITKAIIYTQCQADTATAIVNIDDIASVHIADNIKDTTLCKGQDFTYDVTTPNATGYLWSTGLTYPTRKMTDSGTYSVTAYNDCSVDKKTFTVAVEECSCDVFVPTAFTPNNDLLNDKFKPIVYCNVLNYKFTVYNNLGQLIFETSKTEDAWDGTFKSYPLNRGTYIWKLIYKNPNNKKTYQKAGSIVLIR